MQPAVATDGRYAIDSVGRSIALMEAFTSRGVVTLADAAAITKASRSTAYRILATLERDELIEKVPGGYRSGRQLLVWAARLLSQIDVRATAGPFLRELAEETGETVNLAMLRGSGLVYTDILESSSALRMADRPGSEAPVHATALGKAVGAFVEPSRLSSLVGPEPYVRFTPSTCTTWASLGASLAEVHSRGYALDLEERTIGVACVAAPILVNGTPVAAISVSGPRIRLADAELHRIGSRIADIAARISSRLAPGQVDGHKSLGRLG